MKIAKLFVVTSNLMLTGLVFAAPLSSPFPMDGTTVTHQSRGVISLKQLDTGRWNIDCQYRVTGANPSSDNPLTVSIQGSYWSSPDEVKVSGSGYTPNGLTSSNGTLKINNVLRSGMQGSVNFDNYDSTGDLIVYNCTAWKF